MIAPRPLALFLALLTFMGSARGQHLTLVPSSAPPRSKAVVKLPIDDLVAKTMSDCDAVGSQSPLRTLVRLRRITTRWQAERTTTSFADCASGGTSDDALKPGPDAAGRIPWGSLTKLRIRGLFVDTYSLSNDAAGPVLSCVTPRNPCTT